MPGAAAARGCASWGEDLTETLEIIPRMEGDPARPRRISARRDCEKDHEGRRHSTSALARPGLPASSAMILFEKFGQHQPLNRSASIGHREGVPLSLSTLGRRMRS